MFASAAKLPDGRFAIVVVSEDGTLLRTIPLQGRGHDIALSPNGRRAVMFARRPGTFAVSFDTADRSPPQLFQSPAGRHFYGHGVFSPDGRLLYATENDFDNARGVLGVYDVAAGYRRIGELATHGVGPHDLLLLPDGETLCVANGGIETHPDSGRTKLNLGSMRPSLVFMARQTGEVLARYETTSNLSRLSIRHLCADANGMVWFGGQWQGSLDEAPVLVGRAGRDSPISFCSAFEDSGPRLKGYIGSVAASADGGLIAATAPRAGRTVFVDASTGAVVHETPLQDGCGVAPLPDSGFIISSGLGVLVHARPRGAANVVEGIAFDNHLLDLSG